MPALVTHRVDDDDRISAWRDLQWATSLIMGRFAHDLAKEDLTLEEFDVLVHLAWARGGVLPLRALVASLVSGYQLSRSGLTRLLDRMERDGLVERSLSREDRRQFDVAISNRGRQVFDQVWPGHLEGILRWFSQPLTDGDVTALKRLLTKLIRANEEPTAGNRLTRQEPMPGSALPGPSDRRKAAGRRRRHPPAVQE